MSDEYSYCIGLLDDMCTEPHVVKMANHALETVRKSVREGLSPKERRTLMHDRHILLKRQANLDTREQLILGAWTGTLKDLGLAYELKEEFYQIWESQSRQEALYRLNKWREHVPEHLIFAFKDLLTALKNWQVEIFAYFEHPITNAYTECLNGLIRVMNRMGRGYSFDALRAKMLFTEGTQKVKRLNYKQLPFSKLTDSYSFVTMVRESPEATNLGADISTLIRLLEEGEF